MGLPTDAVPDNPGDAIALASDLVLARDEKMSLQDMAEVSGFPGDDIGDVLRHLGIRVEDDTTVMFGDDDLGMTEFLDGALELLTHDEGHEFLHVVGTSLATIAEAAVSLHIQGPENRAVDLLDNARINIAMTELGLDLATHLAAAFRHHLRQAALRQRLTQSSDARELQHLTIGFVDLVGFTSLSQTLDPDRIVALVTEFETRAHALAQEHQVRLVKMIGDEVMFVAVRAEEAASYSLGMLRDFSTTDVVPRGGLAAGPLVTVHGDYFGPIVNLAARLTETAVPGEILVDATVAGDVATEPAGRRMLKGFDEPVAVHTLIASPS